MADLLSTADQAAIRAALQNVFDTFSDTTITLYKSKGRVDDWAEGAGSDNYDTYTFKGIVTYLTEESDRLITYDTGKVLQSDVKVEVGFDDLAAANLITGNLPDITLGSDYMLIEGKKYYCTTAVPDGPFEAKNVMVVIYGLIENKKE